MERRSRNRRKVDIALVCRVPATPVKARVLDVTADGCRLALRNASLSRGYSVILELAGCEQVRGVVMWRRGSEAGVLFEEPLTAEQALALGARDDAAAAAADLLLQKRA